MSITYLPPLTSNHARTGESLTQEAVTKGPAMGRSRNGTRWHLIRSAYDRLDEWHDEIRRVYTFWCGQTSFDGRILTADEAPPGEPTCGTCYGRREGHDPDRPELLFTPRLLTVPKVCPGSRSGLYAETEQWNRAICLVCGDRVKMRAYGGWHGGNYGPQNHAPGDGLIEGCDFHGWSSLVKAIDTEGETVIACRCQTREVSS